MQLIYSRTPLARSLCNFSEIAVRYGLSPLNLLQIFKKMYKNTTGGLLLKTISPTFPMNWRKASAKNTIIYLQEIKKKKKKKKNGRLG